MTVDGRCLLAPMAGRAGGCATVGGNDILYSLGWVAWVAGQPCCGVAGGAVAPVFGQNGAPCAEVCASIVVTC